MHLYYLYSTRSQQVSLDDSSVAIKRNLIIFLIVCGSIVALIIFITRVGSTRDTSGNLDWKFNPSIRTA